MSIDCITFNSPDLKRFVITSHQPGDTLSTGDTITWVDNGQPSNSNNTVDVAVNGIDQGTSTGSGSYVLTNVPAGPSEVCLIEILRNDLNEVIGVGEECCYIFAGDNVKLFDFGADKALGTVTDADVNNFIPGGVNFSNGEQDLQVANSVLEHTMYPSAAGSTRAEFGSTMPNSRCYTVRQDVTWLSPADFGGVSNQTTKVGFGLGGNNYVSGSTVDPSGWSMRWVQEDGFWKLYSYACERPITATYTFGEYLNNAAVVAVTPDIVQTLELTVCQNTGSNDDGSIIATVDGVVIHQDLNVKLQESDHSITDCRYQSFFGGSDSSWSPDSPQTLTFENVSYTAIP